MKGVCEYGPFLPVPKLSPKKHTHTHTHNKPRGGQKVRLFVGYITKKSHGVAQRATHPIISNNSFDLRNLFFFFHIFPAPPGNFNFAISLMAFRAGGGGRGLRGKVGI